MPTTYAHWRFGDECAKTLPDYLQKIINNNRDIFNIGLHGPDIFFYYNCIKPNDVNKYGSNLHRIAYKDTLEKIKPFYKACENIEASLAYLLGFTCHFALDSYCHSYIDKAELVTPYSHGRIESQYDKHLLILDGYDPIKKSVTFSLKPTKKIAHTIAGLIKDQSEKVIYKSTKDQVFYLNLLKDDTDLKRSILIKLMEGLHANKYKDLLITKNEYKDIEPIMLRLDKLYAKAKEHYKELALSLFNYLEKDEKLDSYFHNVFDHRKDYKDVPYYSLEDEKNYIVKKLD